MNCFDGCKSHTRNNPLKLVNPDNKQRHAVIEGFTPPAPKKRTFQANKGEPKEKEKEQRCGTAIESGEFGVQNKEILQRENYQDTTRKDTTKTKQKH